MSESIESNDMSPSDKAEFEELRRLLVAGIELLSDKQRHVITRYYIEEIGLSEIADEMGVGISRVSKIKQSAIEKLGEGIQAQFTHGPNHAPGIRQLNSSSLTQWQSERLHDLCHSPVDEDFLCECGKSIETDDYCGTMKNFQHTRDEVFSALCESLWEHRASWQNSPTTCVHNTQRHFQLASTMSKPPPVK